MLLLVSAQACSVQGVSVLRLLKDGNLLVGSGSGTFTLCSGTNFKALK